MNSVSIPVSMDSNKIAVKLIKENALNRSGQANFNKYGTKDGCGLVPCSEIFIDNFILETLVPDYLVVRGKYSEASAATTFLWDILKGSKLQKVKTTVINLSKLNEEPSPEKIDMILFKRLDTKTEKYYSQQFKVASNENLDAVVDFLEKNDFCQRSFYLKDIDVTQDYCGSFSKKELIDYLLETAHFRMQGSGSLPTDSLFTILDNNSSVGNNCLTYCGQVGPFKIRCKIYNKMVQMLESKCVREKIGNHLFGWANQTDTRLANARDSSKTRGLTRAEATIYCGEKVPSSESLRYFVQKITDQISPHLVYSTPFSETWRSYCENLFHSLIVVDESLDRAFVVYSFNEITEKVSGHIFKNWLKNQKWIFANLTLNGVLPIDCISFKKSTVQSELSDCVELKVEGKRFFKYSKGYGTDFKMRLVHTNALYTIATDKTKLVQTGSSNRDYIKCYTDQYENRVQNSGLVAHENCIPFLSHTAANKNSAVDVHFSDSVNVEVHFCWGSKQTSFKRKIGLQEKLVHIKKQRNELVIQLSRWSTENKYLDVLKKAYQKTNHVSLSTLTGKTMNILAIREMQSKVFPTKFSLILITEEGKKINCNGNKSIDDQLNLQLTEQVKHGLKIGPSNYFSLLDKPVGVLTVTEKVEWVNRNKHIVCKVDLFSSTEADPNICYNSNLQSFSKDDNSSGLCSQEMSQQPSNSSADSDKNIPLQMESTASELSNFDCVFAYKHLPNLATRKVAINSEITAKSWMKHRGNLKLVVRLSDGFYYQAGKDLERKETNGSISLPQHFVVLQTKIDVATRKREAICILQQ